jgi:hypothetical protein
MFDHPLARRALCALPLLALATACSRTSGVGYGGLYESEPNDYAFNADHFGVVYPGDFLSIGGRITDSGSDPFDGFAFTAGAPMTVTFELWIDAPAADLDVSIWDPQLGGFIATFESPFDPETGAFDVLGGGLDFHIVIDSFVGTSSYTLDVDCRPLYSAATAGGSTPPTASLGAASRGAALDGSRVSGRAAELAEYAGPRTSSDDEAPEAPIDALYQSFLFDEDGQPIGSATLTQAADGSWMGKVQADVSD